MAPMSNQSINYSSNYGEDLAARVNVLASCYVVDSAANLKGLHYCTTGVTGKLLLPISYVDLVIRKTPDSNLPCFVSLGAEWYS